MRIIGFNFTKVSAERFPEKAMGPDRSTNIEFQNIDKEDNRIAKDDSEMLRVSFKFSVIYGEKDKKEKDKDASSAEVALSGFIILMAAKEESKELQEAWKKKELSSSFRVPIFNFILKKCSIRALQLEDELNLPLHVPMPQLKIGKPEDTKEEK